MPATSAVNRTLSRLLPDEQFVTRLEFAERIGAHPNSLVRRARNDPDFPQPIRVQAMRITRYRRSDVERYERKIADQLREAMA